MSTSSRDYFYHQHVRVNQRDEPKQVGLVVCRPDLPFVAKRRAERAGYVGVVVHQQDAIPS